MATSDPLGAGYVYYNIAIDGTVQQLTAALDLDNNAMWKADPRGVSASNSHVYASKIEYQSDPTNNAAGIRWIYYQRKLVTDPLPGAGHPTLSSLTKNNSMVMLPADAIMEFKNLIGELRADEILLNNIFVQGTAGDVLHLRIAVRQNQF